MRTSMNWHPVLNQPLFNTDHAEDDPTEPDLFVFVSCTPLTNSLGDAPPIHVNYFNDFKQSPQYIVVFL